MNAGTLTLTCLTLLVGQLAPDVWPTNDRSFKIPINMNAERRQEISRVILYVSKDKGQSWEQDQMISPTQPEFIFHARSDGEYWFRVAVVDRKGKQHPENIYKLSGDETQKILIDTLRPFVRILSATRQGNEVVVRWEIQENYPDVKSMKLKYRPAGDESAFWSPAAIAPIREEQLQLPINPHNPRTFRGETRVPAAMSQPVEVRLEIRDLAKNFHFAVAQTGGAIKTASFQSETKGKNGGLVKPPPTPAETPMPPKVPAPPPAPIPPANNAVQQPVNPPPPTAQGYNPSKVIWDNETAGAAANQSGQLPHKPIARTSTPYSQVGHVTPPQKPLPPVQIVNKDEVVLQYELAQVGPAGVGSVELWLTKDDGQTWEAWLKDPTITPSIRGGKYKRTLNLPGEGVYGLAIVVRNRAGRGKEPRRGEAPQMRIEVDKSIPEAVLYAPEPDPQRRDSMIIAWEAKDKNLASQPITLEWSQYKNGPWNTIQTNLANTGKHSWKLPAGIPVHVFLRLRVRDQAGNEGLAVTNEPQLVDLSEPQGKLIGVSILASGSQ